MSLKSLGKKLLAANGSSSASPAASGAQCSTRRCQQVKCHSLLLYPTHPYPTTGTRRLFLYILLLLLLLGGCSVSIVCCVCAVCIVYFHRFTFASWISQQHRAKSSSRCWLEGVVCGGGGRSSTALSSAHCLLSSFILFLFFFSVPHGRRLPTCLVARRLQCWTDASKPDAVFNLDPLFTLLLKYLSFIIFGTSSLLATLNQHCF